MKQIVMCFGQMEENSSSQCFIIPWNLAPKVFNGPPTSTILMGNRACSQSKKEKYVTMVNSHDGLIKTSMFRSRFISE